MSELNIEVVRREAAGKNVNRRLRAGGWIPAVVYGGGRDPVPIQVDTKTLHDLLRTSEGRLFKLHLKGTEQSRHAMIREIQVDPVDRSITHIDFQRVLLDEKVRVSVPIELTGVAEGVKNEGGLLDFVTREVEVQCLPQAIPGHLELDITKLHIGTHVEARELTLPEGVELHDDPTRVIVSLTAARVAVETEAEEAEELLTRETDEPELIRKRQDDEE